MNETEHLQSQLNDYKWLFNTVEVAIAIVNQDGSYVDFNEAYLRLMGFPYREQLQQSHPAVLSPELQPNGKISMDMAGEMIQLALSKGKHEFEWTHKRPDGNEFLSHIVLDPIDFGGEKRLRAIIHDISETQRLERIVQGRTNELEHLARTDRLTGLDNRERLEEVLKQEQYRADRYQSSFAIVQLDLDNFQSINEKYGHDTGDKVIVEVAQLIKDFCREADSVCRWSGEEFMILLPESNLDGAYLMADNLRARIESHQFSAIDGLTASFGVDMYQEKENINDLFRRVDQALRNAKETGKNCVEMLS
jgi:diguanylate cyclase (GGDEF)-like protein/PAS domain S-box-containing protein